MLALRTAVFHHLRRVSSPTNLKPWRQRTFSTTACLSKDYLVLAIETSCDDTSVALVQVTTPANEKWGLRVLFHEKVTANNDAYGGIHPLVTLDSHRSNLASLAKNAFHHGLSFTTSLRNYLHFDYGAMYTPDKYLPGQVCIVAVTRGPGMRSNLAVGLEFAKGLAVALEVPLVGVHHMQAHALTARLLSAQENGREMEILRSLPPCDGGPQPQWADKPMSIEPEFPFLSVLVSGGHTMLVDSKSLTDHKVVAETQDIAIGDCLDKAARAILPPELLKAPYGRALEAFAWETTVLPWVQDAQDSPPLPPKSAGAELDLNDNFWTTTEYTVKLDTPAYQSPESRATGGGGYAYTPPLQRQDELKRRPTKWSWSLAPPLSESKGFEKSSRRMVLTFAGLLTAVERFMKYELDGHGALTREPRDPESVSLQERQDMAREVQRVAFEHLASRILLHLSEQGDERRGDTIVVSGGVAANKFLRFALRRILDVRGFKHIELVFPPPELCTDNALMIAWAGVEMYEAGYTSSLDIGPLRKWSMDASAADGGILGASGWMKRDDEKDDESGT